MEYTTTNSKSTQHKMCQRSQPKNTIKVQQFVALISQYTQANKWVLTPIMKTTKENSKFCFNPGERKKFEYQEFISK